MKIKFYLALGLGLLFTWPVFASQPNFPNYTGFVNDYANVLDQATKDSLEDLCHDLEQKTSAELAIAIVETVEPLDSKTYAVKLFEKWKIGKKGKDNGVLILMAMQERRIEIEVGYGLEGIINDAKAGEILDKYVVAYFKQGDFAQGLTNGAEAVAGEIAASAKVELDDKFRAEQKPSSASEGLDWGWISALIAAMVFLSIFRSGWASGIIGGIAGMYFGYGWAGLIGLSIGGVVGFVLAFLFLPLMISSGGFFPGSFGGGGGGGGSFGGGSSGGGGSGRGW